MTAGAVTVRALKTFSLPAPLFRSHPKPPISSDVDFNICLTSSFVKSLLDNINEAVAETKGAAAEVPLNDK